MRFTRAVAVAVLCSIIVDGCAADRRAAPPTYVVRPQDTLYAIAWRHDLDYRDLARWNHIGSDYRLNVGQVLVLRPPGSRGAPRVGTPRVATPGVGTPGVATPGAASRSSPRGMASGGTAPDAPRRPGGSALNPPGSHAGPGADDPRAPEPVPPPGASTWLWPTDHSVPPRPVPGSGILLFGQLGQDIRASAPGRVVYTGSGIRGYGNLIIVKHGDSLLTSYAHNREILVHEGQDVAAGQVIAHMGTGPHQVAALYFEIRVNGKPVDPLPYLSFGR